MADPITIENCGDFAYRCPKSWDALTPTHHGRVRRCSECQREVYYCDTQDELNERSRWGHCVARPLVLKTREEAMRGMPPTGPIAVGQLPQPVFDGRPAPRGRLRRWLAALFKRSQR